MEYKAMLSFDAAPQYWEETLRYSNFNDVINNFLDFRVFTFYTIIRSNASQLYQYIKMSLTSIQYITGTFGYRFTVYDEQALTSQINNYLTS